MEEIADGIFAETGYEGVNVGAIVTSNGLICIDAPTYPRDARDWVTQLDRLPAKSVKNLILTDSNGDRLLNTRWINAPIVTHQSVAEKLNSYEKRYPQSMIDSLVQRNQTYGRELSGSPVDRPALSFSADMKMFEGGRVIQILHMPGPAQGTSWVKVPDAGVLFTGDSTVVDTHPPLVDLCINEWIESLEILVSRGPAAGIIVPGRGENADAIAIDLIVAYLTEIRATIAEHVSAGQSRLELAQYVGRFLPRFPYQDLPYDWLQRQILHGLERVYDELLLQEDGAPVA
jgi:glyoxylase-like metal-dependent hydrolase (beta-lactamase superfamily II)